MTKPICRLIILCKILFCLLLLITPTAFAYPDNYSPFIYSPKKCAITKLELTREDDSSKYFQLADFQIKLYDDHDYRFAGLSYHNKIVLDKVPVTGSSIALYSVIAVDLSPDGKPDFVVTHGSGGNGLAAGYAWRLVFLSSAAGYAVWELNTYDPDDSDFVLTKNGCVLVQTTPVFVEKTLDDKGHYFWVYNLVSFARAKPVYHNAALEGFPKWISYSFKPNHSETRLLNRKQKQTIWQSQESQMRLLMQE